MLTTDLRTNRNAFRHGLLWLILAVPLYAQQSGPVATPQPNCLLQFQLPQSGQTVAPFNSPAFDNRFVGCSSFSVSVQVPTTISALSLVVQTAADNGSTQCSTCTWATFTAATGSNPNTLTTGWTATFTTGTSAYFAWLRVQLTSKTGTGQVTGKLFSSIAGGGGSGSGGGCPGTVGTPCVVVGPTAAGSPVATSPVLVAGSDGTNVQPLNTDSFGGLQPGSLSEVTGDGQPDLVTAFASDGGLTYNLTRQWIFNGATWDRQFLCPHQVLVTLADATLTALVPVSGATVVRVCSVHMSTSGAPETVSLLQGTGVACAGAPVTIDAFLGVTALAIDYSPNGALRTAASNGLCVQQSGAAQAAKVWVSYAQF